MRVIFLNRYFHPDYSATSQMLSDLAFFGRGRHEVCVVTSCQRYDDAAAVLPARERVDGVEVHRVRTTRFGRDNLIGRAADYATFYLAAEALWGPRPRREQRRREVRSARGRASYNPEV